MKILVALKRVADPDNANKVKIPASGDKIETTGLEWKPNPFDEYALEAALRLTEDGKAPKVRAGEVVVVTFGPKETEQTLRAALATGADKAIRVDVTDDKLDGDLVARALKTLVEREKPDVVVMDLSMEGYGGTEAIRRLEVEGFPAIVVNDCRGGDLLGSDDLFGGIGLGDRGCRFDRHFRRRDGFGNAFDHRGCRCLGHDGGFGCARYGGRCRGRGGRTLSHGSPPQPSGGKQNC